MKRIDRAGEVNLNHEGCKMVIVKYQGNITERCYETLLVYQVEITD